MSLTEEQKRSKTSRFLETVAESMADGSFVKLSLGNYKGKTTGLKKILISSVRLKSEMVWSTTYRYKTRDEVKNYPENEGIQKLDEFIQDGFRICTLFTTEFDVIYENIHNKKIVLRKTAPSYTSIPSTDHDVSKKRVIGADKSYLRALGISDKHGKVYKATQDKFRQLNHYINMLDPVVRNLPTDQHIHVADMGSGKGYLTFATYDYMVNTLNLDVDIKGIELRDELVALCNKTAAESGFDQLNFVKGSIQSYTAEKIDVLIALHACDTATDDAIHKGITCDADIIVVAPCCHKQIRREIESNKEETDLDYLLKYGVFTERQAEMVTDGIRAMVLEYFGYKVKVAEFISDSHTPKNVMIIATKTNRKPQSDEKMLEKIKSAMQYFGIKYHHLVGILNL